MGKNFGDFKPCPQLFQILQAIGGQNFGKFEVNCQIHQKKSEHLTISNKRLPSSSEYKIDNIVINKVASAKYLGVTITQNLSWKERITKISNKANSAHRFLQRNLQQCSIDVKSLAYVTYVRPIVEYASVVVPSTLEMVQCKAARFVFASVTAVLEKSNWTILEIE